LYTAFVANFVPPCPEKIARFTENSGLRPTSEHLQFGAETWFRAVLARISPGLVWPGQSHLVSGCGDALGTRQQSSADVPDDQHTTDVLNRITDILFERPDVFFHGGSRGGGIVPIKRRKNICVSTLNAFKILRIIRGDEPDARRSLMKVLQYFCKHRISRSSRDTVMEISV
jgi:hypothetical protein